MLLLVIFWLMYNKVIGLFGPSKQLSNSHQVKMSISHDNLSDVTQAQMLTHTIMF